MTTTRLEADALTLGYADTDVVRELDLRVPHGKVTVIVGANACGKSTLLRGLASSRVVWGVAVTVMRPSLWCVLGRGARAGTVRRRRR